jgi:Holliday junction resolvase-like predicted endonuclease
LETTTPHNVLGTQQKHKGSLAEMLAASWLLGHGYDVFRNVSSHGLVDLVAIEPQSGVVTLVEVRSLCEAQMADGTIRQYARAMSEEQKQRGIRLLAVDLANGRCAWWDRVPAYTRSKDRVVVVIEGGRTGTEE